MSLCVCVRVMSASFKHSKFFADWEKRYETEQSYDV